MHNTERKETKITIKRKIVLVSVGPPFSRDISIIGLYSYTQRTVIHMHE